MNHSAHTPKSGSVQNTYRRNILRLGVFGAIAFVLGKIFGPHVNLFSEQGGELSVGNNTAEKPTFKNFRYVEGRKEIGLYDKFGNELVVFEKE